MISNISSCQYDQVGGAGGGDGGGGGFPTKQTRTIFLFQSLSFFFFLFQSKLENTHTAGQDRHCTVIHDYSRSIIDCTSGIFNGELGIGSIRLNRFD